jgi:competence protein ComEA
MKLPNWMILCVLLLNGASQYSANAAANMPAFSDHFEQFASVGQMLATSSTNNADAKSATNVANTTSTASAAMAPIDINKANVQELSILPGIGAKKAQAIVDYRKLNGKFLSVEELVNVRGIGPKMLAKLGALVFV